MLKSCPQLAECEWSEGSSVIHCAGVERADVWFQSMHSYLPVAIMSSPAVASPLLMQFVIMLRATHVDLCIFGLVARRQRDAACAVHWGGSAPPARRRPASHSDLVSLQVARCHCRNIWHDWRTLLWSWSRAAASHFARLSDVVPVVKRRLLVLLQVVAPLPSFPGHSSINPLKPNSSNCCTLCHKGLTYHFQFLTFGHSGAQPWAPECPNVRKWKW